MKKIISLLLAMIMVFSLATVAAADETVEVKSEAKTFNFTKSYVKAEGENVASKVFPAETLEFEVTAVATADGSNPDGTMISIVDKTIGANPETLVITIPEYTKVGKYNYEIKEKQGVTQGVGYDTTTVIGVQVLVSFNADQTALETQVVFNKKGTEGAANVDKNVKVDEIINTYDVGDLSVQKLVTGNLADETDDFEITVTFTSDQVVLSDITFTGVSDAASLADNKISSTEWTAGEGVWTWEETFVLSHEDTVTFVNIPEGVQWNIVEDSKYQTGDKNTKNYGYDAPKYDSQNGTVEADQDVDATVTNNKETEVDTGIALDSAPYFVILAVAMFGMVALVSKKRYEV